MFGSDFVRPGLLPRANYNIGIGHTFAFLKKNPIGDELTFGYTYENAGTHGFFHTDFGEHTEQLGVMKNFSLPKTKIFTGYTWIQEGITSYTGNAQVQNRLATCVSLGAIVHINLNSSIWDPGKLQQSGDCPLVHHDEHRIHIQLVGSNPQGVLLRPQRCWVP